MCYTVLILGLLCFACLPPAYCMGVGITDWRSTASRETVVRFPDDTRHVTVLVRQAQTTLPDRNEPPTTTPDSASGTEERNKEAPRQNDATPASKDFVPSEKIDADKAVDFPVDI